MSSIAIQKINIVKLSTDAIVNAANDGLWAGSGVCGAIFEAAGYSELEAACDKIGHCDVGSAVITPGFNLKAKYIIHAVGPYWQGGKKQEQKLLYGAYQRSMELACANGCRSIGFPLISAGVFGFPVEEAWKQAIQACADYITAHSDYDIDVTFAVLDEAIWRTGRNTLDSIAPRLRRACCNDWNTQKMPAKHAAFKIQRAFSQAEMAALRKGNIPQEMEDKWFWYMEGNTLYAHRSWTGFCIFVVEFVPGSDVINVTVNRDPEQFKSDSIQGDAEMLNNLLNWWSKPAYDHYGEWLSETVHMMQKAGAIATTDWLDIDGKHADAVYFHKPEEPYGIFSNWYLADMVVDGQAFTSVEQYIMFRKCQIFGDDDSAKLVMGTNDPSEQQKIARHASGYNETVWSGICQAVAFRGLLEKFSQNDDLKKQLLDTGDAYLVECAKTDRRWACGVRLDDEGRRNIENWKGRNILGFTLMEVRAALRQ